MVALMKGRKWENTVASISSINYCTTNNELRSERWNSTEPPVDPLLPLRRCVSNDRVFCCSLKSLRMSLNLPSVSVRIFFHTLHHVRTEMLHIHAKLFNAILDTIRELRMEASPYGH